MNIWPKFDEYIPNISLKTSTSKSRLYLINKEINVRTNSSLIDSFLDLPGLGF